MVETRLGIIGVGGFGIFCLDKCRFIPGVKVTALADINAEALERYAAQFGIPFTTTDWRELVNSPDVDVVHIATPPSLHAEQAIACANAGKHIFCEKPLAISMEEADAIFRAADEHGVRVGIDFVMRYSAIYDLIRTIVQEKLLGAPQRFLFENMAKDLPAGHWFWDPWLSGAIPVEHGVHFFDIFQSILGPGEVRWAGLTRRPGGEADKWFMVLQYGERVFGSFYHGFDKPEIIERTWAEIDFERGKIRIDGWIPETMTLDGIVNHADGKRIKELIPGTQLTLINEKGLTVLADGKEMTVNSWIHAEVSGGEKLAIYGKAVQDAMADFIVWTKDPAHRPRVTGEDGREALRIALQVNELAFANEKDQ